MTEFREESSVTLNVSKDIEVDVPCEMCAIETCHKVLASAECILSIERSIMEIIDYQIIQCQGCKSISFRKCWRDVEAYFDEKLLFYPGTGVLYPSRIINRKLLREKYYLPDQVESIYMESHRAMTNNQPVLAGIGMRALVEAVCKEKSAKGRNLEKKIDDLVQKGILTQTEAEILHGTRLMGNKAAHEIKAHLDEELATAMDVIEHLLQTVYIIQAKAKNLPKRKNQK